MKKTDILQTLAEAKKKYQDEGFILLGLFGSHAKEVADEYSDIDLAYTIEYDRFSQKYKDGFSKILRIDEIRKELEHTFHAKVDLVPDSNKKILEGMIHV
jgi:predicted nucleotidyltransferase